MSLHIDYQCVFEKNKIQNKPSIVQKQLPINMQKQLSSLEYNLSKVKIGNKKQYTFQKLTLDDTNEFIENERQTFNHKRKTWNTLPKYLQWKLIESYINDYSTCTINFEKLKLLVRKKELDVIYNPIDGKITKLNFQLDNGIII